MTDLNTLDSRLRNFSKMLRDIAFGALPVTVFDEMMIGDLKVLYDNATKLSGKLGALADLIDDTRAMIDE